MPDLVAQAHASPVRGHTTVMICADESGEATLRWIAFMCHCLQTPDTEASNERFVFETIVFVPRAATCCGASTSKQLERHHFYFGRTQTGQLSYLQLLASQPKFLDQNEEALKTAVAARRMVSGAASH